MKLPAQIVLVAGFVVGIGAVAARRSNFEVTPADLQACQQTAVHFISDPATKASIIERAVGFCGQSAAVQLPKQVCPNFEDALSESLRATPATKKLSTKDFCQTVESHLLMLRQASDVPNMGKGPLTNFQADPACVPAVSAVLKPHLTITKDHVPSVLYAMCMNQDCAHYLPSRARWCTVQHEPRVSHELCESLLKFSRKGVHAKSTEKMVEYSPSNICQVFKGFGEAMGVSIAAYEHVMHGITKAA